jgi:SsrA-binding protein
MAKTKKGSAKGTTPTGEKVVASNRKARHDYDIIDTHECGMVLRGSEVKALREGKVTLNDAHGRVRDGQMWLLGLHIAPYSSASSHELLEPERDRKLLLHRREIDRIATRLDQEPLTLVPLRLYFKGGRAKLELALARGRKQHDKRHAIAARDADREATRAMSRDQSGKNAYD